MGCNCTKTDGFAKAMENARSTENKTGVTQAVFVNKITKTAYYGAESAIKKMTDICCYYLTDGREVTIPVKKSKSNSSESDNGDKE